MNFTLIVARILKCMSSFLFRRSYWALDKWYRLLTFFSALLIFFDLLVSLTCSDAGVLLHFVGCEFASAFWSASATNNGGLLLSHDGCYMLYVITFDRRK